MYKIYSSIFIVILTFIIIHFISKKYKLDTNQKIIFWLMVFFWSGITIIRSYRKLYAITPENYGGIGLSIVFATEITSAYGLISCFIRFPIFILSDILNRKKIFIQIALIFITITSFITVFKPSYTSLYLSSVAMGICASMLCVFNVLFSETFKKEQAIVSASILSVAPLLAEFIAAPIQYVFTFNTYKNFKFLWLVSAIISSFALVLTFFVKDNFLLKKKFQISKIKKVIKTNNFIYICFIAVLISFIKFASSGANMIAFSKTVLNMPAVFLAYIDVLFSFSQLIASVLVGTYFIKKFSIEKILILGLISNLIFYIIILFSNNYLYAFFGYIFNGFGYGIGYTSVVSMSMQYFEKEDRNISMGIFQAFFALGVFFGDRVYMWILKLIPNGIFLLDINKSIYLIIIAINIFSIILANFKVDKKMI